MSDAMWLEGKEYISSKRASQLSGYAQDYIGQLARKGLIDAQRVGGLWFVSMVSLTEYKSNADTYVPPQPERKTAPEADSLVTFDGKDHISASRAASITGYHPDYVGQLARSGAIISRQVGNRWYIDREGILAHKKEKDNLLGAVQAESVGISRNNDVSIPAEEPHKSHYNGPGPFLNYTSDNRDLLPVMPKAKEIPENEEVKSIHFQEEDLDKEYVVPIRKVRTMTTSTHPYSGDRSTEKHIPARVRTSGKTIYKGTFRTLGVAALTIVIVLSFGFVTLKNSSVYGTNTIRGGVAIERNMFTAGAAGALERIENFLQNFLVKELIYKRVQ